MTHFKCISHYNVIKGFGIGGINAECYKFMLMKLILCYKVGMGNNKSYQISGRDGK